MHADDSLALHTRRRPMTLLRVTLFGSLDMRDESDQALTAVLTQPKRAALLAYLAATQSRGFRRRDSLLALFWPELSERRARDALNSALYFLRRSLGDGVIVGRGSDELGVAEGAVWCDLVAFEAALSQRDDRAALALVRGELLDGLLVADAPEFDDWLSRERERVRHLARDAASRLATAARADGDAAGAVHWARRAHEIAPEDEGALRFLLSALEGAGDVAGALRLFDNFSQHMRRTFELEPAEQTVALAEAIRDRNQRAASPPPTDPVGDTSRLAPPPMSALPLAARDVVHVPRAAAEADPSAAADTTVGAAPADLPAQRIAARTVGSARMPSAGSRAPATANAWAPAPADVRGAIAPAGGNGRTQAWRHASFAALLVLLVVVAAGGATILKRGRGEARERAAGDERTALAVFPFTYHGADTSLFLGEGVARLLGTSLDGISELRVVDPRALLSAARSADSAPRGPDDDARWRSLASALHAALYVSGEIDASGDSLDVRAALQDAAGGSRVLARAQVRAGRDELFAVVDQLALQLMAALPATPGARIERVAARTTHSLPALRLYLAGEGEFRRGRFAEAIEAFRGAIAADSTFSLALFRLSNALTWSRLPQEPAPDSLAQAAIRHGAGLPERDRILFRAWLSYLHGDAVDAEQRYREVLSTRPDDVEANFYLGEVLFHWGPIFGRPALEARAPFEHVLAFEPENAGALSHLVRLAATAGDAEQVRRYASRLEQLNPDPAEVTDVRTLEAFATRDSAAMRQFEDSLPRQSARDARRLIWTIAAHTHDAEAIGRLFSALEAPPFDPFARRQGTLARALHLVAQGRPGEADAALAPNDILSPARSVEYRAAIATLPFVTTPPAVLARIERALLGTGAREMAVGPGQYSLPADGIYPPRRLYLLGLLRLRQDDPAGAARYADSLASVAWENNRNRLFSRGFASLLRSELLARENRPGEALATLGLPGVEEDSNLTELTSYPKAHERYLRAELLRRLGRPREAARWYGTFPDPQLSDLMYRTIAAFRNAELAEARGEREAAREGFRRAAAAWRNAEAPFQSLRAAAFAGWRRSGGVAPAPEVDASPLPR